jgi:hypothetical protein
MKNQLLTVCLCCLLLGPVYSQTYNSVPENDVSTSTDISVLARKGNKVLLVANDEVSTEGLKHLHNGLNEFNYWIVVDSPEEADFIIELTCVKKLQITAYVVYSSSRFINANGKAILETKEYKGSPTAFNDFNALNGSIQKMIEKDYRKKFSN